MLFHNLVSSRTLHLMATQLVSLAGFRLFTSKQFAQEASYGERGSNVSLSKRPISPYQQIETHKSFGDDSRERISRCSEGEKPNEHKLQRQRDVKLFHRFGLWFLASPVSYLLKKAKVLFYGLCGNAFNHPGMELEVSLVDAYFSVPVVSATTTYPCRLISY